MGDVYLPGSPQDVGAGDEKAAFAHFPAVDEGGGVTGDEDENFSCVAKAVIADGAPSNQVRGDMVEEDQPKRDRGEKIEPQIASGGHHEGMHSRRSFARLGTQLNLVGLCPAWESRHRYGCRPGAQAVHYGRTCDEAPGVEGGRWTPPKQRIGP